MTELTHQLAATHDHWFQEPAVSHALPAIKLWWRHFSKRQPVLADALEWSGCGAIAIFILFGSLIAIS